MRDGTYARDPAQVGPRGRARSTTRRSTAPSTSERRGAARAPIAAGRRRRRRRRSARSRCAIPGAGSPRRSCSWRAPRWRCSVATQPALRVGTGRRLPVLVARARTALVATLELTAIAMALGIALGVAARGHAPVAQPAGRGRELALHLGLPRHAGARPAAVLELHRRALPDASPSAIPFGGPVLMHADANTLITPFAAATLGLALNEGAYMAEIVRAGIISVDEGPDRRRARARHDAAADDAPHRAAAGDARDRPADRQRGDLDAQDDVARQRDRLHGPAVFGPAHLLRPTTSRCRC